MIVNNKCELIIKNHSRTLGGGTRNHQAFAANLRKTPKIFRNLLWSLDTRANLC